GGRRGGVGGAGGGGAAGARPRPGGRGAAAGARRERRADGGAAPKARHRASRAGRSPGHAGRDGRARRSVAAAGRGRGRAHGPGGVTRAEEQQAIEEALDRLLDPLAEDERPPPPMPEIVPLDSVRRGDRVVFRITRRFAGWGG